MGRKLGDSGPLFEEGERCYHLAQSGLGRGLPPNQMASSSIQPFGHNRYGPKIGGSAPLGEGQLGPQCGQAEAYLLAKFHLHPSNRLATMHQRYRQDRQTGHTGHTDNGPIAYRTNRFTNGRPKTGRVVVASGKRLRSLCV